MYTQLPRATNLDNACHCMVAASGEDATSETRAPTVGLEEHWGLNHEESRGRGATSDQVQ
jgi:hypothetical protein